MKQKLAKNEKRFTPHILTDPNSQQGACQVREHRRRQSRPGQEIEHPMAIVIMGGLVTSTLLNLLFMPALYWKFAKPSLRHFERSL